MPKGIRKKAAKRPAKKSTTQTTLANYELVPVVPTNNKDTEVESLAAICSILDNWTPEQRKRNLEFIVAKFYDFS